MQASLANLRGDLSRQIDNTEAQAKEWGARTMLRLDNNQGRMRMITEQLEVLKTEELATHANLTEHCLISNGQTTRNGRMHVPLITPQLRTIIRSMFQKMQSLLQYRILLSYHLLQQYQFFLENTRSDRINS